MFRVACRRFSSVVENKLLIDGQWRSSAATEWFDILDPATQELVARVPQATDAEFKEAVDSAADAFKTWRDVPVPQRIRIMLKYQQLIRENNDRLVEVITRENGKTLADSAGDIFRGLEVVEHTASFGSLL
jgi:malonate-semialdehyde dehydrogenase (acetylating)/methylmalonate-semialdehyde dehydrogenase